MAANDTHYNTDLSQSASSSMNGMNANGGMNDSRNNLTIPSGESTGMIPQIGNGTQNSFGNNNFGMTIPLPDTEILPLPDTENNANNYRPNRPNRPSQPSQPGQPNRPSRPSQPEQPNRPSQPSQPEQPNRPSQPSRPSFPIRPSLPSLPSRPSLPVRPGGTITIPVFPTFPIYPNYPNLPSTPSVNYGQVRFLNASSNLRTVNISIDGNAYVTGAGFSTLSDYDWISDGFHTITIRNAVGLRTILLQQTFPFTAGQKVTMVLTDAADGGLELVRVVDTGCGNLPSNTGCFRFANMAYNGLRVDVMLGNQTVFRNIGYQNVSNYKQAVAGSYQFTVTSASSYSYIRELPIIVISNIGTGTSNRQNILNFNATIAAGKNYTSYLIGNTWSNARLQVITAED